MKKIIFFVFVSIQFISAQNQIAYEQFSACSLPANWNLLIEKGTSGFPLLKAICFLLRMLPAVLFTIKHLQQMEEIKNFQLQQKSLIYLHMTNMF
ncbi:MAG: hypothetical protein IPK91_02060 [Saprospiraceae bacterium]|nr:hypothetical protein [Saprospiraceae bacterium]